jgi:hypothetical protein
MRGANPDAALLQALGNAVRNFEAREIRLRCLPTRGESPINAAWIAEALVEYRLVAGRMKEHGIRGAPKSYSDQPVARGTGATALAAIAAILPEPWREA